MTVFTNNAGNDTFHGIAGEYDQVDYLQSLSEFSFTRNADGSVTVFHPTIGTDTLFDIDGIWSIACLLYTSPSPRDQRGSRMPSSA